MAKPTIADKKPMNVQLEPGDHYWCSCGKSSNQPFCDGSHRGTDFTPVKFTIDEEGNVSDAHVFWDFKDDSIDSLLLEAVCNMPNWKPAKYANGTQTSQEFVLTVGNRENCIIHTLNIHQD